MRISKKLADMMNAQFGNEMGAAMQYTQIAAYFDARSLPKFAEFFAWYIKLFLHLFYVRKLY